jgi:hypothetical protein
MWYKVNHIMKPDFRAEIMWFLIKCLVGAFPFLGWFVLYSLGMIPIWLGIAAAKFDWAIPTAFLLGLPAAALALPKAMNYVEKWERGF